MLNARPGYFTMHTGNPATQTGRVTERTTNIVLCTVHVIQFTGGIKRGGGNENIHTQSNKRGVGSGKIGREGVKGGRLVYAFSPCFANSRIATFLLNLLTGAVTNKSVPYCAAYYALYYQSDTVSLNRDRILRWEVH